MDHVLVANEEDVRKTALELVYPYGGPRPQNDSKIALLCNQVQESKQPNL
jgi:hypothetical protein